MANSMSIAGEYLFEFANAWTNLGPAMGTDGPLKGKYYATGEYGNAPFEGAPEYQDLEITLPGVDGIGIKRLGFRGRPIYVRVVFVGADKTEAETEKNTFFNLITPLASFSITLPGGTARPSCRIVHGSAGQGQWQYMGGMYCLLVDMQFRQMRLT